MNNSKTRQGKKDYLETNEKITHRFYIENKLRQMAADNNENR